MKPKNEPGIPRWRGDSLKLRRIAAGWTAQALAAEVGVSKSTLIRWEQGENAPTSDHVRELARVLDVQMDAFSKQPRVI